jgi:hypothetical protein
MKITTRLIASTAVAVGLACGSCATARAGEVSAGRVSDGHHQGQSGTTGAPSVDNSVYRVPASQQPRVAAKSRMAHNLATGAPLLQGVDRSAAGLRMTSLSTNSVGALAIPSSAQTRHVLHWEGEGNGNKGYTCGPAASRNVIQSLMGKDYGEAVFASWEHTSSTTGTSSAAIASALELHFGHIDSWSTTAPTSPTNLYAEVKLLVGGYHHGTVQNVRTSYLPFWNGHATNHFNAAVGYTTSTVTVGEEWWPAKIGLSSNYGQPYGFHAVTPTADYNAIHYAPSHRFIG